MSALAGPYHTRRMAVVGSSAYPRKRFGGLMAEPLTTDAVPTSTIEGYRMTEPLTEFS